MSDLSIRVGDLNFSARWEPDAPRTIAVIRAMLPLRARLIHCRWSGESTWIPYGDLRPDVGWEHHTSHPAPGPARALSRAASASARSSSRTGRARPSSKVGQLAANHFATVLPEDGWEDRLQEVGRRCLWDGAQDIEIVELG